MTTFTTQDRQDAQRTPLTLEEINKIHNEVCGWGDPSNDEVEFARAIERAHGIGE
jgi:hypothetical protein